MRATWKDPFSWVVIHGTKTTRIFALKIANSRKNIRHQRKIGKEMKRGNFPELKGTVGSSTCSGQKGTCLHRGLVSWVACVTRKRPPKNCPQRTQSTGPPGTPRLLQQALEIWGKGSKAWELWRKALPTQDFITVELSILTRVRFKWENFQRIFSQEINLLWKLWSFYSTMKITRPGTRQNGNATWEMKGMGTGRAAMPHGKWRAWGPAEQQCNMGEIKDTKPCRAAIHHGEKKKAITGQSAKNKQWSTLWDFNMTPFGAQGISQTMGGKVTRARGLGDKRQQAVFCSGQGCRRHTLTTSCAYLHRVQQSTFHRGWGGIHEAPILQAVCCAN